MKRIFASVFLATLALGAGAQTLQDAFDFAGNDYLGTARSVGMGNAVTAVGGDLGSLTFNPAGSAVAGYSQFTITPGLSISSVVGQGTYVGDAPYGFEDKIRTQSTRMNLPNFGAVIAYDTRKSRGLRRVSFGMVGNVTRDYNYRLRASGTNAETTLAGSLASQADGYPESVLQGGFYQSDMPSWETMVGYKAGLIDPISGREGGYIGLTERLLSTGEAQLADRIGQYYGLRRSGSKYDLLMNLALDFSDRFFVGANIGITTLDYRSDETRAEDGLSGITYPSGFESLQMRTALRDEGTGIYAKLGFIARPTGSLRIGAAIQTPTVLRIRENYQLEGRSVAHGEEWSYSSPEDEWYYSLRSPLRLNAGVAYTIGKVALVSADYEYFNYNKMRFVTDYDDDYTDFSGVNADIRDFARATHALRIGGELKPIPQMALRVGYNYMTSPDVDVKAGRQSVSFGIGYSSAGSFFVDAAVRFQYLPDEFITPYYYYGWDDQGSYKTADATPEICSQASLCNALLTLGWRF
ncbi:MAG: hypothetical protein IJ156_04925 [Bacteroidales bacterium]|nr:hypothetical protein [Bacteroidales bacterium]